MESPKKKKVSCAFCNKRLKTFISQFVCKCKNIYCTKCRYTFVHKCTIDTFKNSQEEINKEYKALKEAKNLNINLTEKVKQLCEEIKEVNLNLWNIEDELRICEKRKVFGEKFTELARGVYLNNDKRSKIKSEINKILGSNIKEIKLYANY